MTNPANWSLLESGIVVGVCAAIIALLGTRLTRVVDQLADRTGLGEAIAGAVLLGAATSFSGIVVSVTAAWKAHPELAISNALGGIAVQTLFLVVADVFYRRANLEHAAASTPNMVQAALLMTLLSMLLAAPYFPDFSIWGVHPATFVLVATYIYGINLVKGAREVPMWRPAATRETREDVPAGEDSTPALPRLAGEFVVLMLLMGLTGWILEPAGNNIATQTGLGHTAVGVLLTATSTSLPELVTSVAAVRRGALTLAVGGIIGGNAFDTIFTAASDVAYRDGSIYHAISDETQFWVILSLLMTTILMMGLIRREEQGPGRIGVESVAVAVVYGIGVAGLFLGGEGTAGG